NAIRTEPAQLARLLGRGQKGEIACGWNGLGLEDVPRGVGDRPRLRQGGQLARIDARRLSRLSAAGATAHGAGHVVPDPKWGAATGTEERDHHGHLRCGSRWCNLAAGASGCLEPFKSLATSHCGGKCCPSQDAVNNPDSLTDFPPTFEALAP